MVHVCVLWENRQYSEDTLLKDVAKEVQTVSLMRFSGPRWTENCRSFTRRWKEGTKSGVLTAADKPGIQTLPAQCGL